MLDMEPSPPQFGLTRIGEADIATQLTALQRTRQIRDGLIPILTFDNPRLPNRGGRWT